MLRLTLIASLVSMAALSLSGCPCAPDANQLRILNNSNDVLIEVDVRRCFSSGGRQFTQPIFPGEERVLGAVFDDGCVDVFVRGDLGGQWIARGVDLNCGEIETLQLTPGGGLDNIREPSLIDQILLLLFDNLFG